MNKPGSDSPSARVQPAAGTTKTLRIVTLASAVFVIGALYFGREVLIPIALAILLSFLLAPVVSRVERWGLARVPAVLAVVLSAVALIGITGWFVVGQVSDFAEMLPEYKQTLQRKIDDLRDGEGGQLGRAAQVVEELGRQINPAAIDTSSPKVQRVEVVTPRVGAVSSIWNALGSVLEFLGFAAIIALLVFFMLIQRVELRDHLVWLAGDRRLHLTTQMLEDASKRVSQFLFAQFLVNCTHGLLVAIGLTIIGVPNSLLWGLVSFLFRFIPYVGPWIAAICPTVVALAVFDGWTEALYTIGLIAVLELITNNLLEPFAYEVRTGVSPLAIVVSALFWTWLWGGVGLVLAMPLTVCLMVVGEHIPRLRVLSTLLGRKSGLAPSARLYQRLLAGDHDGAWETVAGLLKTESLVQVFDTAMLPALRLAAQDLRPGHVDEARQETIERILVELVDEAAEHHAGSEAGSALVRPDSAPPVGAADEKPLKILALPASDAADEVACRMLAAALREQGMECEIVSVECFAGEMLEAVQRIGPDVVCVSHVPPPTLTPVRYLCKRLVERYPNLPVIVGVWTSDVDEKQVRSRLPREGQFHVASTLEQARFQARQLFETLRLQPDRGAPSTRSTEAEPHPRADPRGGAAPAGA